MKTMAPSLAVACIVMAGPVVAGPLEDGIAAMQQGDYATALTLLKPLAEQGFAGAQFSVGGLYDNGQGVTQDYAEAVKWYRLAGEQGLAAAEDKLGFMYVSGKGVPQDYAEAAKWYQLAAKQGFAAGEHGLGILYSNGTGVPQDDVTAYMWFKLAAAQGDHGAAVNSDMLARLMTPDQIAEGDRRVKDWKPQ